MERYPECKIVLCEPLEDGGGTSIGLGPGRPIVWPGEGFEDVALDAARVLSRWLYRSRREALEESTGLTFRGDEMQIGKDILKRFGPPMLYDVAKMDSPTGRQLLPGDRD